MEHDPRWVAVLGLLAVATLVPPAAAEARKGHEGRGPAASGKPKAPRSGQAHVEAPAAEPSHQAAHQQDVSADPRRSKSERRRNRKRRRLATVRVLRERWGKEALMMPPVRAALKVHSWRMARLRRIKDLAQKRGEPKIVAKADALIDQEQGRFVRHMEQLKASGPVAKQDKSADDKPAKKDKRPVSHAPTQEGSVTRASPPTRKSTSAGAQAASTRADGEPSP
jgi:hypothetical protein